MYKCNLYKCIDNHGGYIFLKTIYTTYNINKAESFVIRFNSKRKVTSDSFGIFYAKKGQTFCMYDCE